MQFDKRTFMFAFKCEVSNKNSFDTMILTYLGQCDGLEGQWHRIDAIRTVSENNPRQMVVI